MLSRLHEQTRACSTHSSVKLVINCCDCCQYLLTILLCQLGYPTGMLVCKRAMGTFPNKQASQSWSCTCQPPQSLQFEMAERVVVCKQGEQMSNCTLHKRMVFL